MLKFEDDCNRLIAVVAICATILTIGCVYLYNCRIRNFVDNGYTQKTLPGVYWAVWVKE